LSPGAFLCRWPLVGDLRAIGNAPLRRFRLHCRKNRPRSGTKSPQSYSRQDMRRLPATFLDLMKFVQAIGVGLRAGYDDIACAPVPEYLLALVRELNGDQKPQTPMRRLTSPRKFGVRIESS